VDVTSSLAQALLFTTDADLSCHILVAANDKFISVFVRAFRKSDATGHHLVNPAAD